MSNNDHLIKTDNPFTEEERIFLGRLASLIIPASEQHGIPGADDEAILARILTKGVKHKSLLKKGLNDLVQLSEDGQKNLKLLDDDELSSLFDAFEESHKPFVQLLMTLTAQSYYQDERVLQSLDMEARPPFPKGHEVQQGDWSLLDPVRQKNKLYREV